MPTSTARAAELAKYHRYRDSVRWRVTARGVAIEGRGVERTPGPPVTVTRVWEAYADDVNAAAKKYDVPAHLIVATICTESTGRADAIRFEPRYVSDQATPHQVSPGLMQTLISTARAALGRPRIDRKWLFVPRNSIMAGTAYIASQARSTAHDPPLVAAAYNAGRLAYEGSAGNRWKLRQYPIGTSEHCDRFVKWLNDAAYVLPSHRIRPAIGLEALVGEASPPRPSTDGAGKDIRGEGVHRLRPERRPQGAHAALAPRPHRRPPRSRPRRRPRLEHVPLAGRSGSRDVREPRAARRYAPEGALRPVRRRGDRRLPARQGGQAHRRADQTRHGAEDRRDRSVTGLTSRRRPSRPQRLRRRPHLDREAAGVRARGTRRAPRLELPDAAERPGYHLEIPQ